MEYGLGQYELLNHLAARPFVLILVLMEYGLGHNEQQSLDVFSYAVLILVLMEYGLGRFLYGGVQNKA